MPDTYLDAPFFEGSSNEITVDITATPFFYNKDGNPTYVATLPGGITPLTPAKTDPSLAIGYEHDVSGVIDFKKDGKWGEQTQLGFEGREIAYEPMWATRERAAAFGITLVEPGQAVQLA